MSSEPHKEQQQPKEQCACNCPMNINAECTAPCGKYRCSRKHYVNAPDCEDIMSTGYEQGVKDGARQAREEEREKVIYECSALAYMAMKEDYRDGVRVVRMKDIESLRENSTESFCEIPQNIVIPPKRKYQREDVQEERGSLYWAERGHF